MNESDGKCPRIWLRWPLSAGFLYAMIAVGASQTEAHDAGGRPEADPTRSIEFETIASWLVNRLEAVKTWNQKVLGQNKSVERISREIDDLANKIKKTKYKDTDGLGLELMFPKSDVSNIRSSGTNLVIVANVNGELYFRIFDDGGRIIRDTNETLLPKQSEPIADLKRQLDNLRHPYQPTGPEQDRVIAAVTSIVGLTPTDYLDRLREANEKIAAAAAELEAARERSYSLTPNLSRLVLESAEVRLQNARQVRVDLEKYTRRKELDAVKVEVTRLEDQLSDLMKRQDQERVKLKALERQAKTAELSEQESKILALLDETIRLRDKGQPELAEKSLVEATRLWRQEIAGQFKSRYREYQQPPGKDSRETQIRPPSR
jgi:hypothetical protein